MSTPQSKIRFTVAHYLTIERETEERYTYLGGFDKAAVKDAASLGCAVVQALDLRHVTGAAILPHVARVKWQTEQVTPSSSRG